MMATMAVSIWENEELTKVGEPYKASEGVFNMTRAEFERLKALGQ